MAHENKYLLFVVEDNTVYNHLVSEHLKKQGYTRLKSIFSGEECIQLMEKGEIPDIVIQDYSLAGMTGLDVLVKAKKISPKSEFIFLTANENMEVAVNTIKFGAYDYVVKDSMAMEKVAFKLRKIVKMLNLEKKNIMIRKFMIIFFAVVLVAVILLAIAYGFDILK